MERGTIGIGVGLLLLAACGGPAGRRITPAEYARFEQEAAAPERDVDLAQEFEAGRGQLQDRLREAGREGEDHATERDLLEVRRSRLALEHEAAVAAEADELLRAAREREWTRSDLEHFDAVEQPLELEGAALALQESEDELFWAREELAQLELMYGAAELGDSTAEIVLERTRRRLAGAERRQRLEQKRHDVLRGRTLPRRRDELAARLREKEVALERLRHEQKIAALARQIALTEVEKEERALRRRTEDLARRRQKIDDDLRGFERQSATRGAGP